MIMKMCRRCKRLIVYPAIYCDVCLPTVEEEREANRKIGQKYSNRKYDKTRSKEYVQFYHSTEWKILSAKYMQDKDYKCEECKKMATQVHHKFPIQTGLGWERRLDYDNLQCVCDRCHNKHHKRFGFRGK